MNEQFSRRRFLAAAAASGGVMAATSARAAEPRPALLGGTPVRTASFPGWPVRDDEDAKALAEVLHSGNWFRGNGKAVERFERSYAEWTGARHCIATANGTSALFAALEAVGVGPGDEVIVPPYTFIATVNVVLLRYALPIFVDTDPQTFQIDATKIEAAITERTAAILPVHLGGNAADMDAILAAAGRHGLPVIEDACQAHLAQWRGRCLGTLGTAGCFSFQASKNLNSGEGGAILTGDADVAARCYAFHNNGRPHGLTGQGANLRMTEFQGALLLAQMTRLARQAEIREQNAAYLASLLREIPGVRPAAMYPGCTRNAYHLFLFRYDRESFAGLPKSKFIAAMRAEGVSVSGGYSPLNKESFLRIALKSKGFRRIYPAALLDQWEERNHCPANDCLCDEGLWLIHNMLLGPRRDMDDIAAAVRKIHAHAAVLART